MTNARRTQVVTGLVSGIFGAVLGLAVGGLTSHEVVIDTNGHTTGEVLVDSDGDGDFEWMSEDELHEMRGHIDMGDDETHAHTP